MVEHEWLKGGMYKSDLIATMLNIFANFLLSAKEPTTNLPSEMREWEIPVRPFGAGDDGVRRSSFQVSAASVWNLFTISHWYK